MPVSACGPECMELGNDSRAFTRTVDIESLSLPCAIMLVLAVVIPQPYQANHREFPGASGATAIAEMNETSG